jgi:hypothetical protein
MSLRSFSDKSYYYFGGDMTVLIGNRVLKSCTAALLVLCALLISACSSTKMAYRYADWGIVWWVEDYVTPNDAQKQQLNVDINEFRQWHCSTELPRYQSWLSGLESDIDQGTLDMTAVAFHQEQLFGFFPPLLSKVIPIATNLLASLSDAQVRELAENMKQKQQEFEEEFLTDNLEASAAARAERTRERVERWLGDLNIDQRAIVQTWSEQRGRQTEIWLQGRRNWQQALLSALERRSEEGFANEIERLIKEPDEAQGEEYRSMMAESSTAMKTLMVDLIQASDTTHLAHLSNRTAELKSDFETLTCSPAPEVAALTGNQMVR